MPDAAAIREADKHRRAEAETTLAQHAGVKLVYC